MIPMQLQRSANGFTLVEMGIVLAVTTTLAAVVIPSVIQSYRMDMAEKVVDDFKKIAEVSRAYALDNPTGSDFGRWPGLDFNGAPQNFIESGCHFKNSEGPFGSLVREGYLNAPLVDPWGAEYQFGIGSTCWGPLSVRTAPDSVPTDLYVSIVAQLPETECSGNTCTMTIRLPTLNNWYDSTTESCGIHQTETVAYFATTTPGPVDSCVARRTWCMNNNRGLTIKTYVPTQFTENNCPVEIRCNQCVGSLCVQNLCVPANQFGDITTCPGSTIPMAQLQAACGF